MVTLEAVAGDVSKLLGRQQADLLCKVAAGGVPHKVHTVLIAQRPEHKGQVLLQRGGGGGGEGGVAGTVGVAHPVAVGNISLSVHPVGEVREGGDRVGGQGGASGGYTAARQPIVDLLRQRSRSYLFSNTLAPAICAATIQTIDLLEKDTSLRDKVHANAVYFRAEMEKLGFELLPGEHPIVPVMLYDPKVAHEFARRMLDKGVYVVAFCYPVVPKGKDRIRTQISAGHTKEDLDFAIKCFGEVKAEMGL